MVGIFDPKGRLIPETVCIRRKGARQGFAAWSGKKWNQLWKQGYRVHKII